VLTTPLSFSLTTTPTPTASSTSTTTIGDFFFFHWVDSFQLVQITMLLFVSLIIQYSSLSGFDLWTE